MTFKTKKGMKIPFFVCVCVCYFSILSIAAGLSIGTMVKP